MDEKAYAETVIQETYTRTLAGKLKWEIGDKWLKAALTRSIKVSLSFEDLGPDSAAWKTVSITNPVGSGSTFLTSPNEKLAKYAPFFVSAESLGKIDKLFDLLMLEPRRKQFAAAMEDLTQG